jgi:hypothetical protein
MDNELAKRAPRHEFDTEFLPGWDDLGLIWLLRMP